MNHPISDAKIIFKEVKALYEKLNVLPSDLRGLGIQLSKLEKSSSNNAGLSKFLNQAKISNTKTGEPESNCKVTSKPLMSNNELENLDLKICSSSNNTEQVLNGSAKGIKNLNNKESSSSDKNDNKTVVVVTKGRRGRPKNALGKNNSKTANISYTGINKYFKSGKTDPHNSKVCI